MIRLLSGPEWGPASRNSAVRRALEPWDLRRACREAQRASAQVYRAKVPTRPRDRARRRRRHGSRGRRRRRPRSSRWTGMSRSTCSKARY